MPGFGTILFEVSGSGDPGWMHYGGGAGSTMTLPMDIRLAASVAQAGFVFSRRRGLVPEAC